MNSYSHYHYSNGLENGFALVWSWSQYALVLVLTQSQVSWSLPQHYRRQQTKLSFSSLTLVHYLGFNPCHGFLLSTSYGWRHSGNLTLYFL